jgi:capsular polysaccharide transport system permease protein
MKQDFSNGAHALPVASAWRVQRRVVFALFTRELKARFGHFRLGFFWALAEPISLVLVMSAVRLAFGNQDISGVSYPLFFAAGIVPYLFFQTAVTQSLSTIESNLPLLNYRQVKPADAVMARCLLEFLIYTASGLLLIGGMAYGGFHFRWNSALDLFATLACLTAFTLGLSLITAVVGALYRESQKIIPIAMRPFFFISGIFFAADSLPPKLREWLLLNPLLHVSELVRSAIFLDYESHHGSLSYLATSALIMFFLGLSVYRLNRIRVATSGEIK